MQAAQRVGARLQLALRQAEAETAGPLEGNVETRRLLQLGGKTRPGVRRAHRPARIFGHAEPLGLHPDQREVAARGAHGIVALIEQRHPLT